MCLCAYIQRGSMNTFVNCRATNCGGAGFAFGEGVQASLHGCYSEGNSIGYLLHENSDIQITGSTAKKNNIGTEIISGNKNQLDYHASRRPSSYVSKPVSYGGCSYEMSYAIAYLIQVLKYNPFE